MTLTFKDASDFSGRTVSENLINQVANMDRLAGPNDFNVSNHANAFNGKATGFEVWYYAGDAIAKAIAEKVSAAGASALGIVNRGAKPTTNLYVISKSQGHTILIEWFFIDNPSDVAKWHTNKQAAIAAVMKVFESYPQYNFKSSHGGHYGLNLMDPGACGNGLKEAVVMQEVNKIILNYKLGGDTMTYHRSGTEFKALRDLPVKRLTGNWEDAGLTITKGTTFFIEKVNVSATSTNATLINNLGRVTLDTAWVQKIK